MPKTVPRDLRITELAYVISSTKIDERTLRIWEVKSWMEFSKVEGVKVVKVDSRKNALFLWRWLLSRPIESDRKVVKKPVKVEARRVEKPVARSVVKPVSKSVSGPTVKPVKPVRLIKGRRFVTSEVARNYLGMSVAEFGHFSFPKFNRTEEYKGKNLWPAVLMEETKANQLSTQNPKK